MGIYAQYLLIYLIVVHIYMVINDWYSFGFEELYLTVSFVS
jgi:hypothetical protein